MLSLIKTLLSTTNRIVDYVVQDVITCIYIKNNCSLDGVNVYLVMEETIM